MLSSWSELPDFLRTPEVRLRYDKLAACRRDLFAKRCLDIAVSSVLLTGLLPVLCAVAAAVKLDNPSGTVLFRAQRVTQNGRLFLICKFRTMRTGSEAFSQVTTRGDDRVTRVGRLLRRCKLDELPQLWNVLTGDMTLVGVRPESPRYVAAYTPEMRATLLLPAGITSPASLRFREEEKLLPPDSRLADKIYTRVILPEKMRDNLAYLDHFSFGGDFSILVQTARKLIFRSDNRTSER